MDTESTDQSPQDPLVNPLDVRDSVVQENMQADDTPLNEEEVSFFH